MTQPAAPPAPAPPAPPVEQTPPPEKMLSQSEVNRIAAREKDEGKAAALKEVQESLGVDLDTAKQILKEHNERTESQKTEAEKARAAADKEKEQAAAERAAATAELHQARVDRAFLAAGVSDEAKIAKFGKLLDVAEGATPDDIKAAVEHLKTDMPELFSSTVTPPKAPPAPSSDPKGGPPAPKVNEDAYERGLRLARERGNQGNSYPDKTG